MPSDDLDQTSPQADRLSRKIDRLLSGQPSPVHDGDTEDLANLAKILMDRLDRERPDPEFREQLKQDLIDPGPRLVPMKPRSGPRRYPIPALFGALTIVLVASAMTGWMVFADRSGTSHDQLRGIARFATATPSSASAIMAAGSTMTADSQSLRTSAPGGDVASPGTATPEPVSASSIPDVSQEFAAGAQIYHAVVSLPPVDASHVELGALATVSASSEVPSRDVRFSQAADLESLDLGDTGMAYRFASPYVNAEVILRGVQEFLGIDAQIEPRERGGKTVYALSSPEGSVNFTWSPDSGAFSCTLPEPYSTEDIEDLSQAAIQWVREFGFPIGNAEIRPVIQTTGDGQTYVHVPIGDADLPNPAVGHPMSITLVVDDEGRIVSVSGYWLQVTSQGSGHLVSAEQAWDAVRTGGGYWPQGTAPDEAGEFAAERFEVRYMLTSSEQPGDGLTLQPVIAISGNFIPDDGSGSYSTTVYVQGMPQY